MAPARTLRVLALAAALAPVAAAAAGAPGQLFYERTLMSAADARCGLFTPQVAAALAASAQQAKGAALRSGADRPSLAAVEQRARDTASSVACGSADLKLAAERVRQGFAGYARLNTMSFPGDLATWTAERAVPSTQPASDWRLSQPARGAQGPALFGLAAQGASESLTAVAGWPAALSASGARLIVRDPAKSGRPYIDTRRQGLEGRIAPRTVSTAYLASGKAAAGPGLLPAGAISGAAFRFPVAAVRALEGLDPREALVLELVYPTRDGERTERIAFEVGDFAAGRAFLTAGR